MNMAGKVIDSDKGKLTMLVEQTLTDGSTVYNVDVSDGCDTVRLYCGTKEKAETLFKAILDNAPND